MVRGEGSETEFMASDGEWYPIADADMAHIYDTVRVLDNLTKVTVMKFTNLI